MFSDESMLFPDSLTFFFYVFRLIYIICCVFVSHQPMSTIKNNMLT
jgi:hypothetical protein